MSQEELTDYNYAVAQLAMLKHYLDERDNIVTDAFKAGLSKSEIHRISGLNRETVKLIIDRMERESGTT